MKKKKKYLCEEPRRIPKVNLVLKINNATFLNAALLKDNLTVFCPQKLLKQGALEPPSLFLVCQTRKGEVVNLMLNLKEIFSNIRESNQLNIGSLLSGNFFLKKNR